MISDPDPHFLPHQNLKQTDFHVSFTTIRIVDIKLPSFSAQTLSATLWAGTNSGQILVFLLNLPSGGAEKRATEKPVAMLAKEIQLRHKAPVISIQAKY